MRLVARSGVGGHHREVMRVFSGSSGHAGGAAQQVGGNRHPVVAFCDERRDREGRGDPAMPAPFEEETEGYGEKGAGCGLGDDGGYLACCTARN